MGISLEDGLAAIGRSVVGASLLLLSGCSQPPTADDCVQYETRAECEAAGCEGWERAIRADIAEDGACVLDASKEPEGVCLLEDPEGSEDSPWFYYRDSAPESDIRRFDAQYFPVEGWTQCAEDCGCEIE